MGERISKTEFALFCGQLANAVDGFAFAPIIFVLYGLHEKSFYLVFKENKVFYCAKGRGPTESHRGR